MLTFVLAVAVACALAGARNFREAGDHSADLPQDVLRRTSAGRRTRCVGRSSRPSETRIRTLIQPHRRGMLETYRRLAEGLADAGRLDGLLTAIAIDGKWLRGVLDGQVKLLSAMLHEEKAVIAQLRVPDDTTEATQVRAMLEHVGLDGAVVTADAVTRGGTPRVHRGQGGRRRPGIGRTSCS